MLANIKRWGNSAGVRIPTSILKAVNLSIDSPVDVSERDGVIIIQPAGARYDVETLIAGITPENRHGEVAFEPVGKESL